MDIPFRPIGATIYKIQPVSFRKTNNKADGTEICILDIEHHTFVQEQTDDATTSVIVSNGQPSQVHYAWNYRPDSLGVDRLIHGVEIQNIERVCSLKCRAMLKDDVAVQELRHKHYGILT